MKSPLPFIFSAWLLGILGLPAATLYVARQSPNPTPPYATWDTAARNIQEAVNVAEPGATLLVTNGVYPGLITIGKPLTLLSVNGALATALDGGGTNRCVCLSNDSSEIRASLSGFTLTNGRVPSIPSIGYFDGGAVYSLWRQAFLTNCILGGNTASNGGAAYGARLFSCILKGNTATNVGGATCLSELFNCTVTGNAAGLRGGGAFGGVLYNSIVYYNSAPTGPNFDGVWGATNSCTTPLAPGEGNITAEPMFVDYAAGNLRLQAGSPCIDAANGFYVNGATDLDGNPRIAGLAADLGAYEYQPSGPPQIGMQPISQSAYVGGTVVFRVSAAGSAPLSWQWGHDGAPLRDATNSTLTLAAVKMSDGGRYSVVVTNSLGSATSQEAVLTVMDTAPMIWQQPLSQNVYAGVTVVFNARAVGSLPLSWQWRSNNIPMADATNESLTISPVTSYSAGSYSAVVTNALGSVTSQVAVLTVLTSGNPPNIYAQPLSQTVYSGSNVTFSVGASPWPLSYQWRFNDNPVVGWNDYVLTLPSVTVDRAGNYSAVVTNLLGSVTSQVAVLTVLDAAPTITLQPQNQEVTAGQNVTFATSAKGSFPMVPQWLFNGTEIPDATNWTLLLPMVTADQAGSYTVVVTNALGTATSAEALLAVRAPAICYVWQGSPNPTAPYATWETAAHEIQDAVDAALRGDEVVVTNGVYATGGRALDTTNNLVNRVFVNKAITVRSVNGPEVTIIQGYQVPGTTNGTEAVRCVYLAGDASLVGFTLTNGATRRDWSYSSACGGGVYGELSYAPDWSYSHYSRVSNCRIIGNAADEAGGGVYFCALNNCLVVSNTAGNYAGGAYLGTMTNCTVVGNFASYGSGMYASSAFNSILYYNQGENWTGSKGSMIVFCCMTPDIYFATWHNITSEPRFVDGPGGDFHLQPDSPCINSGRNGSASGDVDFDGNPRIVGANVDIGAYEFQSPASGLSYAWLAKYGLPTDGSADCVDSDGDGMDNSQEYVCGTDPTSRASVLRLVSVTPSPTNVAIKWESVAGLLYRLERSTNLAAPFQPDSTNSVVATEITGLGGTNIFFDSTVMQSGAALYRVGVRN